VINPKIPVFVREDSNEKTNRSGSMSPTLNGPYVIHRKRSHASAGE